MEKGGAVPERERRKLQRAERQRRDGEESISLLDNLNMDKIKMDIKKIRCSDKDKIIQRFSDYNIKHLLDVIE